MAVGLKRDRSPGHDAREAIASAARTIQLEARGPARARSRARSRAGRQLRRSGCRHPLLPRTGDRHRHGQERPYRHEGRRHAVLHRHAGVLRASERGEPRRPRHDHPRRRDPRLLLVGRNRRARQSRVLFAPIRRAADRRHVERRKHAGQGGRSGAGPSAKQGSLPARARADHLDHDAARARRLPRHCAAREQGLHGARLQVFCIPAASSARG